MIHLFLCLLIINSCYSLFNETNHIDVRVKVVENGNSGKFADECLNAHNYYRSLHGTPGLTNSPQLQQMALSRARHIIEKEDFSHDGSDDNVGENLFLATSSDNFPPANCPGAITDWYQEQEHYNYRTGQSTTGAAVGHFTQVVWKATRQVGCGYAKGRFNWQPSTVIVCEYLPPGNYEGQFKENVPPPRQSTKNEL